MNIINYKPNRFLIHWMVAALLIWPLSLFMSISLWAAVSLPLGFLGQWGSIGAFIPLLETITMLIIPSLVVGYIIGSAQKTLAGADLDWHLNNWRKLSIAGALSGGLLIATLLYFTQLDKQILWLLTMPIFMLVLSSFQWLEMRQAAREAWLWILANVTGALVFSGLLFMNQPNPMSDNHTFLSFALWILATLAQGMITGIVLLWLYDRPLADSENELAPVYLEVRNHDDS
jgi:hypothetical protein